MQVAEIQQAPPPWAGVFALPAFDEQIPAKRSSTEGLAEFAKFALASEKAGIPLVGTTHDDADVVCLKSWGAWIDTELQGCTLDADLSFNLTGENFSVALTPHASIPLFKVKSVVEALNAELAGLGWFVLNKIEYCAGLYCYGFGIYAHLVGGMRFQECDTDEEFIRTAGPDFGIEVPDGEIPQDIRAAFEAEVSAMPSDMQKLVDGHSHLLFSSMLPTDRPSLKQVKAALPTLSAEGRAIVEGLMAIHEMPDCGFERNFDEGELIGALAVLAWDERTDWVKEIVSDYEQDIYNSGEGSELISQREIVLANAKEKDYDNTAAALKNLIHRLKALDQVLKHFPQEGE